MALFEIVRSREWFLLLRCRLSLNSGVQFEWGLYFLHLISPRIACPLLPVRFLIPWQLLSSRRDVVWLCAQEALSQEVSGGLPQLCCDFFPWRLGSSGAGLCRGSACSSAAWSCSGRGGSGQAFTGFACPVPSLVWPFVFMPESSSSHPQFDGGLWQNISEAVTSS